MQSRALAAECVGGPHDGTFAVIRSEASEEFPLRIAMRWEGRPVYYRRRHRPTHEGYRIYYEFLEDEASSDGNKATA